MLLYFAILGQGLKVHIFKIAPTSSPQSGLGVGEPSPGICIFKKSLFPLSLPHLHDSEADGPENTLWETLGYLEYIPGGIYTQMEWRVGQAEHETLSQAMPREGSQRHWGKMGKRLKGGRTRLSWGITA